LLNRCRAHCSKFSALHATIQLYEAREGVPAGLKAMAATDRRSHNPLNLHNLLQKMTPTLRTSTPKFLPSTSNFALDDKVNGR
jgi:hypothetical protein